MSDAMSDPTREDLAVQPAQKTDEPEPPAYDLAEIVARYQTPLLRYVGQWVGPNYAEDIAQEAFLRLHRQATREGGVQRISSWLFRVAHNLAMDRLRSLGREEAGRQQAATDPNAPADSVDALGEMIHREACQRALDELGRLPDEQRQVLMLKVMEGLTLREVGEITGLTPGNAAYRIDRGLRELARRLKASGVI
jgi:RNA polymerase sigma-70 factor (ECF subfamily)